MNNSKLDQDKNALLENKLKFIEYKLNLLMENILTLEDTDITVMDLWKSRGKNNGEDAKQ